MEDYLFQQILPAKPALGEHWLVCIPAGIQLDRKLGVEIPSLLLETIFLLSFIRKYEDTVFKLRKCLEMYRIQILVKFHYLVSGKIVSDNISVFEIGVKTLEWELKWCLTGLTSHTFFCRLQKLFQFYLNQWKHIRVLFKFQL